MRTRTYRSASIAHAPPQQELTSWAAAAAIAAIAAAGGIAALFHLVPAAAAALAPQVGATGAHLILGALYGLAALVVLSVLRSQPRVNRAHVGAAWPCARRTTPG